ncbi:hypothetical protein Tco_1082211 [Tanacetum coccineum]|uniref:Uncharacterized protein n=1 Tax=Tanacetum coccineum TaxID=301880 RepID=A0ABQ5HZR8_9ASTR
MNHLGCTSDNSLDELRSSDFDLFSDQEEYSKEEVVETMAETMEQYMSKTRADYGSGVARPKIEDKDNFELKGQLGTTFSGSDHEDANEHIEKVLKSQQVIRLRNRNHLDRLPHGKIVEDKVSKQILPTCSYCKENGGDQQLSARTR